MAQSNSGAAQRFSFEKFEIDLRALELRKDGAKIKLEGQPLRILALLVERPGELVSRDDLRQQLWPGNTIVDFEQSINAAIRRLREALGDSAETPRFIETLPRRGYRFIQPVQAVYAPLNSRAGRYGWQASLMALALLVVGVAVNAFGLRDRLMGLGNGRANIALAVLPLKNLSGDSSQNYYADGISEALITELGKIGRLQVLSFQSVSRYRETLKPMPQIARELHVDALLEGSVIRSGDRVRITAKLFQAAPERQLLSETYEFDARDILTVQAQVAREVATRARVRLTAQEQARLSTSRPIDPEAYKAYLLGRAYDSRSHARGAPKAKEYYEKAIANDPTYAPAYAALAELYADAAQVTVFRTPKEARVKSRELADKALSLDDGLAGAHAALARVAQQEWDWPTAERRYQRAIELNPSYALARIWYAMYLCAMERFDEAVMQAKRAQQLDPASSYVNAWAGSAYFFAGHEDEATATWQLALELDPEYASISLALARSYVMRGRHEQAIAVLKTGLTYNPHHPFLLGAWAHVLARSGRRQEALKVVADLERRHASDEVIAPIGTIWAYAGLEDYDAAFAWLEKAYEDRRDRIVWLKVDPLLAPLHRDPRFADLVRRMNMPTQIAKR